MTYSDPDTVTNSVIQTFTGEMFDIFNPERHKIQLRDISHAISMICRYGGHTREFYSVAEHCVLMAGWFVDQEKYDLARVALLHDATEAYMGDLVRPLKLQPALTHYRVVEDNLQGAIFSNYGLPPGMPMEVKEADLRICNDERAVLMHDRAWSIDVYPHLGVTLQCWTQHQAEQSWLDMYWRLFG